MKDVKNKTEIYNPADAKPEITEEAPVEQAADMDAVQNHADESDTDKRRRKFNILALVSIVLAFAAWVLLSFDGPVALGTSIVAFFCGCFGLKAATRSWRNTAITAIVASSVLMVVLTAFLIVLYVGLESV